MKYLVIEMQTGENGVVTPLAYTFDTLNEAESKYHYVLSFAAAGTLPMHAASLLRSDGAVLESRYYEHLPEPEETEPGDE